MTSQAPRIGLVGLGAIGLQAHLPALLRAHRAGNLELVGLVDTVPERRAAALTAASADAPSAASTPASTARAAAPSAAVTTDGTAAAAADGTAAAAADGAGAATAGRMVDGERRLEAYDSVDAMLESSRPDGVVLATPPWVTTNLAAGLLERGFAVLAEKPIATSTAAAAPLVDLAPRARDRLQVGLTYRHDPALALLRERIAAGPLDGPLLIRAHVYDERHNPSDVEHETRIRETLAHGSPVVHEGAHLFDWLAFLLDAEPAVEDAWAVRTDPAYAAPNLVGARLRYPRAGGDTVALCEFGWLTDALPRCELSVLGQRAYAVLDGFTFALRIDGPAEEDGSSRIEAYDPSRESGVDRTTRCFDRQLAVFLDVVRGSTARAVPGLTEGLAALSVSERVGERLGARPGERVAASGPAEPLPESPPDRS